jgi:hypothetical protein
MLGLDGEPFEPGEKVEKNLAYKVGVKLFWFGLVSGWLAGSLATWLAVRL